MRRFFTIIALLCGLAPLHAQEAETPLIRLETGEASRGWEGVGRLDIGETGFCTAALIRDRLILTAAHCVYDRNGRPVDAANLTFSAGLRGGRAEATRGVRRFVAHPDYVYTGRTARADGVAMDIAVLELDRPIRLSRVQPFPVATDPRPGDRIGVVSYGRDRANAASLQEVCSVVGRQNGVVILTCEVEQGSSGSPVFTLVDGRPRIVSVVSAMAEMAGAQVALGTSLNEPLAELLRHFESVGPANPGGEQRFVAQGARNDTGAKFVSNRSDTGAKFVRP